MWLIYTNTNAIAKIADRLTLDKRGFIGKW